MIMSSIQLNRNLIETYGEVYPSLIYYLSPDSACIRNEHFENAVVKLQKGVMAEATLSEQEKQTVGKFLIADVTPFIAEENEDGILEVTIVQKAEAEVKRQNLNHEGHPSSTYEKVFHVIPTSNICERLFSRAKLVLSDKRKN